MTDINAVQANDTAQPKTRAQLQNDAMVIETMLNTVLAMACTHNIQDTMTIVEMAHGYAEQLNHDLDSVNMQEVVA